MKKSRLLIFALAFAVSACGDDDGTPADAGTDVAAVDAGTDASGTDTGGTDTGGTDAGTDTGEDAGTSCDYNGFVAVNDFLDIDGDGHFLDLESADTEPNDFISLELWSGLGGATEAGTYTIADENYADCGNCILLGQNCTGEGGCSKLFLANTGTLEITTLNATTLEGTLSNMTLVEIDLDDDDNSTPVAGGETWCISSFSFAGRTEGR